MNFDEYEQKSQRIYADFATTIEFILDQAIAASGGPVPQSIQSRAKDASHLKPKLEDRGLLESDSIEHEIKDLVGARLIFYTNTDVDRFLSSRLIPDNFEVHWDQTRIHHPTVENAEAQYRAVHYTVSLGAARTALPEYQRFASLRCEIQIQTILIHAWAETSHDILYKPPSSTGFGDQGLAAIRKRMTRVMDKYLVPAGYELQKVQHDFERLMQGKALFDRGTIETLEQCENNNERYDILTNIQEYVLPNYDDIEAIYPEIQRVLIQAVEAARTTETQQIQTAFGNFDGKNPVDIAKIAIEILERLRYVDVEGTFQSLAAIYIKEPDKEVREQIVQAVEKLSEYNLAVLRKIGLYAQITLTDVAERFDADASEARRSLLLALWRAALSSEVSGTTWSSDSLMISSGSVQADENLVKIRASAIAGLFKLYDQTHSLSGKRAIITTLNEATRLPNQANYSNDLTVLVTENAIRIVEMCRPACKIDPV